LLTADSPVPPITFLLAGFNRLFRECLTEAFREDESLEMCEAGEGGDLAQQIAELHPEVVVLNVDGREDEGLALIAKLSREHREVKLLVFGMDETHASILRFIEAGAHGYVPRTASIVEFRAALSLAVRGEMAASPSVAYAMFARLAELAQLRRRTETLESLRLSTREVDILRLMARGLSNREIATRLSLSYHTVKNHVQNIFRKLDVARRMEAVEHARRQGWLDE
jgi:DNA-binding NarL/FixJ family response regulator